MQATGIKGKVVRRKASARPQAINKSEMRATLQLLVRYRFMFQAAVLYVYVIYIVCWLMSTVDGVAVDRRYACYHTYVCYVVQTDRARNDAAIRLRTIYLISTPS